jgi:hypothetical protein
MKEETIIDGFIWVKDASRPRLCDQDKTFIQIFKEMFGPDFLENTVIVFSNWSYSKDAERRRGIQKASLEVVRQQLIGSIIGKNRHRGTFSDIPMIALDALHDQGDYQQVREFNKSKADLWNVIQDFGSMPVMDLRIAEDKISKLSQQVYRLTSALKKANKDREIQVKRLQTKLGKNAADVKNSKNSPGRRTTQITEEPVIEEKEHVHVEVSTSAAPHINWAFRPSITSLGPPPPLITPPWITGAYTADFFARNNNQFASVLPPTIDSHRLMRRSF